MKTSFLDNIIKKIKNTTFRDKLIIVLVCVCAIQQLIIRLRGGGGAIPTDMQQRSSTVQLKTPQHHMRPCTQNPYTGVIGPLDDIANRMDIWLHNLTAVGARASSKYVLY
jgi:hypothetical protein